MANLLSSSRTFLIATFLFSSLSAAAYNVSTEPQKKNILFEEATGIQCTSCPFVAPAIERVKSTYPTANIIAIHGYHFKSSLYDLTTPGGDEIVDYFDIKSYPQAMINRRLFTGMDLRFLSEQFWTGSLIAESKIQAPVNLWMSSRLDQQTGIVTISVEGYCVEDITSLQPYLTVVMTQDNILAPQKGQSKSKYTHNHVLRDFITPTWGVPVLITEEGNYFDISFEYRLPEMIGDFQVVPEDLKFIAFVSAERVDVMNSTSSVLSYETSDPGEDNPGEDNSDDPGEDNPDDPGEDNPGDSSDPSDNSDPSDPGEDNPGDSSDPSDNSDPSNPGEDNPGDPSDPSDNPSDPEQPSAAVVSPEAALDSEVTVWDVNGRILLRTRDRAAVGTLPPGLYIMKARGVVSRILIPAR